MELNLKYNIIYIITPKIKQLGTNLYVQDSYEGNYKIVMNEE